MLFNRSCIIVLCVSLCVFCNAHESSSETEASEEISPFYFVPKVNITVTIESPDDQDTNAKFDYKGRSYKYSRWLVQISPASVITRCRRFQ